MQKGNAEKYGCRVVKEYRAPTVKPTKLPDSPWQDLALDLLGPMPTGEYLFVLVDYFSRWMEVDVVHSTNSDRIIKCLDSHFVRYGVPKTLRTDNGANLGVRNGEVPIRDGGETQAHHTPLAKSKWGSRETESFFAEGHESSTC